MSKGLGPVQKKVIAHFEGVTHDIRSNVAKAIPGYSRNSINGAIRRLIKRKVLIEGRWRSLSHIDKHPRQRPKVLSFDKDSEDYKKYYKNKG